MRYDTLSIGRFDQNFRETFETFEDSLQQSASTNWSLPVLRQSWCAYLRDPLSDATRNGQKPKNGKSSIDKVQLDLVPWKSIDGCVQPIRFVRKSMPSPEGDEISDCRLEK